ncbi:hypothetical protein Salat_2529000 [Sesamum alatum]|uniref:Uncharacterized protein n=1 Tax=Sesamum alatum TaxID=300844 RepID=A0AAE2CCI8_9LAMI|nr:hypothetical protein Salat_2529000 [Sesamum alatum]
MVFSLFSTGESGVAGQAVCSDLRVLGSKISFTTMISMTMDRIMGQLIRGLQLTNDEDARMAMPDEVWYRNRGQYQLFLVGRVLMNKAYNFKGMSRFPKGMLNAVHDLPLSRKNQGIAPLIGNQIRRFKELELDEHGYPWAAFLRMRVALDVNLPLKRALWLRPSSKEDLVVTFTYERLSNFCLRYSWESDRRLQGQWASYLASQRIQADLTEGAGIPWLGACMPIQEAGCSKDDVNTGLDRSANELSRDIIMRGHPDLTASWIYQSSF